MLPPPMQDSLPVGWLAFSGRDSNPLDRVERFPSFYISVPLSWIYPDAMSLPPRRGGNAASVRFRHPMLPSPSGCELGPRVKHFRGHIYVHCRYGPVTRDLPKGDLVDRLQDFGFPPPCYPNYRASDFYPGRSVSC